LPTSACLELLVRFSALLLNVLPEFLCFSSWADFRLFASAMAKASRRLGAALGLWLTTLVEAGSGSPSSSPASDTVEEGRLEECAELAGVLKGSSAPRSPGAGDEDPTRTQSSPAGLSSLLGSGTEPLEEEPSCSSPQNMVEIEENIVTSCFLLLAKKVLSPVATCVSPCFPGGRLCLLSLPTFYQSGRVFGKCSLSNLRLLSSERSCWRMRRRVCGRVNCTRGSHSLCGDRRRGGGGIA